MFPACCKLIFYYLVISPILWLSVANKDVYIIYCLLFIYSALSVTYLPPRGATVHAPNRKSVKKVKSFPSRCIECHWVMAEVCSLRMCLLWFTEYFHGFYGHIGWDAGNLSIPYWGNSEKLQPYQELFFNLEMVNSGPFYAVFFKVHWPFNVTLIGSIFKSCKFWSCLQFFTSCELYNTNFYLEVMWINVAEFEHGLSRLIIDKQTETADPCRRIYCLTSVWCWEITQLKDKGEENKFNIILFISMFVFE